MECFLRVRLYAIADALELTGISSESLLVVLLFVCVCEFIAVFFSV